jgi:hypothetical protein
MPVPVSQQRRARTQASLPAQRGRQIMRMDMCASGNRAACPPDREPELAHRRSVRTDDRDRF